MKTFQKDDLKIECIDECDALMLVWSGRSLLANPESFLNPYLSEALDASPKRKIIMDFTRLVLMNSSTIPPILFFLKNAEESKTAIEVKYDTGVFWQRTTFKLIKVLVTDYQYIKLISIETPEAE